MWRVWAPTGQQTCTRAPQSALLMPPGHLLARVLVGGRRRAAVALRRAALQARIHFAVAGHGAFCFAVDVCREATSLWPRGFAKLQCDCCVYGSVGAQPLQRWLDAETRHPASEPGG